MTKAADLSKTGSLVNTSGQIGLTTGVTGTLPIANGGTNSTSTTYCSLTTNVTGTLPVANGGTGATTQAGAAAAVLPSQTGNSGKYLTTDGSNTSWGTVTSNPGTVTSVAASGGTGISVSGSPITSSGTITITNTGVTSVSASTGISVSASTGGVTITNTSPNQLTTTSGSPAYYGARAWASFDGTSGSIRASVNTSSVTRNGAGYYTVNMSTAMPDTNYSVAGTAGNNNGSGAYAFQAHNTSSNTFSAPSTSAFTVTSCQSNLGYRDTNYVSVAVFR